jgi:hypothetical protein
VNDAGRAACEGSNGSHVNCPGGVFLALANVDIVKRGAVEHDFRACLVEGAVEGRVVGDVQLGVRVGTRRVAKQGLQITGELATTAGNQRSHRTSEKLSNSGFTS